MERIYLDHAATTPLDNEILAKMLPYFTENFGNPNSPHGAGRKAMAAVDNARDTLATLLNAKPNEVYFDEAAKKKLSEIDSGPNSHYQLISKKDRGSPCLFIFSSNTVP